MALAYPIEPGLTWQQHYVKYGFTVLRNLVNPEYVQRAREEACRVVACTNPPQEWTVKDIAKSQMAEEAMASPVFQAVFDQPEIRQLLDDALGKNEWDGNRLFQLFISAYDPEASPRLAEVGHIDFVRCPIPVLGSGLVMQVALNDTEPFSGNITIWPGTHAEVQRRLIEDPTRQYPQEFADIFGEPFEFVANAGDVILFHHLVFHGGNINHAANRSPRIALHCQACRKTWAESVDTAREGMSPWEASLTLNGPYKVVGDEKKMREKFYAGSSREAGAPGRY